MTEYLTYFNILCLQTYAQAAKDRAAYTAALGRGQFPDSALLATERRLDLILDGVKFNVQSALHGPNAMLLTCNSTTVLAKVRILLTS